MNCVFELDDFQTDEISLYALAELKRRNRLFKATCFTIYGGCDLGILRDVARLDWIEIAIHGLDHQTEHLWKREEMKMFLDSVESTGLFVRVFKMPWFDLPGDPALDVLKERGYRYATRQRRQLKTLKRHGIETYLGCPWTMYSHPFTLPDKLNAIDIGKFDKFLTVSEMFTDQTARENGWVWRED